jgi:hypothetical protein
MSGEAEAAPFRFGVPGIEQWSRTLGGRLPTYESPGYTDDEPFPDVSEYAPGWRAQALGSSGITTSKFPAFRTKEGFDAWKKDHDERKDAYGNVHISPYQFDDKHDIDGDKINDVIIWEGEPGKSQIISVNGQKIKRSRWAEDVDWFNPHTDEPHQNYYKWQFDKKSKHDAEHAKQKSKLRDLYLEFQRKVVSPVYRTLQISSKAKKKFPASRITSMLINLWGRDQLDNEYLKKREVIAAAAESGLNPQQIVNMWHATDDYRLKLIRVLTPVVDGIVGNDAEVKRVLAAHIANILKWYAADLK